VTTYDHDPNANLDYRWDWSEWLAEAGDTITNHTVTVTGTVALGTHSHTATTVTAWLSGGTAGENARVTARITTAQGRIDDRTIVLAVRHR
jgi:methylglyoxal synthase